MYKNSHGQVYIMLPLLLYVILTVFCLFAYFPPNKIVTTGALNIISATYHISTISYILLGWLCDTSPFRSCQAAGSSQQKPFQPCSFFIHHQTRGKFNITLLRLCLHESTLQGYLTTGISCIIGLSYLYVKILKKQIIQYSQQKLFGKNTIFSASKIQD